MTMTQWRPDPTFYPSPRMAMKAPSEKLAYLALLNPKLAGKPDAIAVVDVDPTSNTYSQVVGQVEMPNTGDELHHFGWNACSSCLSPYAPHAHMERRYLIVPGIRSSRIHVIDTKPDARQPKIVKVIEPETLAQRTGYSRPHTVHCGPDGIYVSALGSTTGDGPGEYSSWIRKVSTCLGNGNWTAAPSTWPTISGGTWAATQWLPANGEPRKHLRTGLSLTCCSTVVMVIPCTSGTCAAGATYRFSAWARSTNWSSRFVRPMTPQKPTDLWVWLSR